MYDDYIQEETTRKISYFNGLLEKILDNTNVLVDGYDSFNSM